MTRPARAALAVALLAPALALAQGRPRPGPGPQEPPSRGPSTAAERKRAVEVTRRLEKDPFGKGAREDRRWLFEWIVAIPDINVTLCGGPLNALVEDPGLHGRELYAQDGFGMAAFIIENPKRKDDWVAVQTAGLESLLRMYDTLVSRDEEERRPELDRLEAARKAGKLPELVKSEVKCDAEANSPDAI